MKTTLLLLAAALSLGVTAASAATVRISEGSRAPILGSIDLGDVRGAPTGAYDTGTLGAGDSLELYGRIVGAVDTFAFTSAQSFTVSFLFGGYETAKGVVRASGFIGTGTRDNTSVFRLLDATDPSRMIAERTYTSSILSEDGNGGTARIFAGGPGSYLFQIDGSRQGNGGNAALYDIEISAVPLPASALLLLAGVGALGAMRRMKAATA